MRQGLARDWAGQCHLDRWTRTWWESHCLQKRNWRGEHLQDMYINQAYQDMPCTLPENYPKWKQRKDQHRWRTGPWCRSRSPACSAAGSTWRGRWATFEKLKTELFYLLFSMPWLPSSLSATAVPYISMLAVNTTSSNHWDTWAINLCIAQTRLDWLVDFLVENPPLRGRNPRGVSCAQRTSLGDDLWSPGHWYKVQRIKEIAIGLQFSLENNPIKKAEYTYKDFTNL